MLSAAAAEGDFPRTWTYTLSGGNGAQYTLSLQKTDSGTSSLLIADGGILGNAIHIEATIRKGVFVGARGTLKLVTSDMDPTKITTTIWNLTPQGG
jgi:hypothetical protein